MIISEDSIINTNVYKYMLKVILYIVLIFQLLYSQTDYRSFRRISLKSNFEFAVYNHGLVFGDYIAGVNPIRFNPIAANYPRGKQSFQVDYHRNGPIFLTIKQGKPLTSDANYFRVDFIPNLTHGPFSQTVPGRIGDILAPSDTLYKGVGWRYHDNPDYIVYSSLDYNAKGVDISGANYNDWPIRLLNGVEQYIPDPQERYLYPAVYRSEEDMFTIFKDTDTRADEHYEGPDGKSEPIGIEYHHYVYSWGSGPEKDIVIYRYDILNRSGIDLDSSYFAYGEGISFEQYQSSGQPNIPVKNSIKIISERNISFIESLNDENWRINWRTIGEPPVIGFGFLKTPVGYSGIENGLVRAITIDSTSYTPPPSSKGIFTNYSDSAAYYVFKIKRYYGTVPLKEFNSGPTILTGPFLLRKDEKTTIYLSYIFAKDSAKLILLDDHIKRMHANNYQRPSPPPSATLTGKGLNNAVRLQWNSVSEQATDIIVPDSLGKPFKGYRLLRAQRKEGPYVEIGKWTTDSVLVHEFTDQGSDIGGLRNNVRYYYQLLSFDAGAPMLDLDPMETAPTEGVNSISVVPTTEPSNIAASSGSGTLSDGTLGNISALQLLPTNAGNYASFFSNRNFTMDLTTTSDGKEYFFPVTIKDTISGRSQNIVITPNLKVHGSSSTAGIKEGKAFIPNLFGLGGANVEFQYRYEQLADSFRITPTLSRGDVPVILNDSMKQTGVLVIDPFKTLPRRLVLHFTSLRVDSQSVLLKRYIPYLTVEVRENGLPLSDSVIWRAAGIREGTGTGNVFNRALPRYYLSGTLSNGEKWDFSLQMTYYNSSIAFDFGDRGVGNGRPSPSFLWGSGHRKGTIDFQVGDSVVLEWHGGVRGEFPNAAKITLTGGGTSSSEVSQQLMDGIRIVPNPYIVRHAAQSGAPRIYFNYLPDRCTIRIYTIALDLVKTIEHNTGSREEWDLLTEGGQSVASQMLYAYIEAPNGVKTIKKFAVVMGK